MHGCVCVFISVRECMSTRACVCCNALVKKGTVKF